MVRKKWFDRKFEFDHLNGTIDGILERLSSTPLRLNHKIASISSVSYTVATEGSWSIQEQVGHLLDLEPLWLGRLKDMKNKLEEMRAADLENLKTHAANHNAQDMNQLLHHFEKERAGFVQEIYTNKDQAEILSALHPRLKTPMRLIDLAYFVAEHDDHHLASISLLTKNHNK